MSDTSERARSFRLNRLGLVGLCALMAAACSTEPEPSDAPSEASTPRPRPSNDDLQGASGAPSSPDSTDVDAPGGGPIAPPQTPPDDAEAPPPEARTCDDELDLDTIHALIVADLLGSSDAPFRRYISLSNRVNQGVCTEDLEADRQALKKAVNSLSTETRIVVPVALDANQSLFRIDLRDLGWQQPVVVGGVEFEDKWEAILAETAYAVEMEGDQADEAKLNAGTTVPVLYGDALIDVATNGELYYALIGVGETEADLAAALGVDLDDVDLRAGTTASKLSAQDALMERFDAGRVRGYYWARHDVGIARGDVSVLADPLGFVGDTVAVVFSLRNELNGYALFDAQGRRIEDTDVILDARQRDGRVHSGVSCMQCHASGINGIADEVRAHAQRNLLSFGVEVNDILDDFPAQDEIDAAIADDNQLYTAALTRAGLGALTSDPVSAAFLRFDADVTFEVAAGLLGVTPARLERDFGTLIARADPALSALETGTLSREQFDELYLEAFCVIQSTSGNRPAASACAEVGR